MKKKSKLRIFLELVVAVVICNLAGVIGSMFTSGSVGGWYLEIVKPAFNPPGWVFGPVWTTLFVLMGISLWFIWNKGWKTKGVKIAIIIFFVQLVLNSLWSFLFFGLQSPLYALIEIFVLWIAILLTIIFSFRVSRVAGYLLLPYILWVSFAIILNFSIVLLN